ILGSVTNRPTFAAALLLIATTSPVALASQAARAAACREWQQCRQLALEAADRGDYETFHDLAWRAGQTGKRHDPALMYLLGLAPRRADRGPRPRSSPAASRRRRFGWRGSPSASSRADSCSAIAADGH